MYDNDCCYKKNRCCIDLVLTIIFVLLAFIIGVLIGAVTGLFAALGLGAVIAIIAILVILALVMIGIGVLGLKIVGYLTIGQIISIKRSCIEPVIVTGCKEVQTSGKGRLYENIYYLPFKCVYCINIENHSYEVGYKRIMVKQKPKSKSYYVTDADFLFSDTTVFEQMWNDILY